MAIISIPTSIAGISIPGFSLNAPNGPLAALFGNNFGTNILQYPRDLNSNQKGHVVQFTIYDVRPANITDAAAKLDTGITKAKAAVTNLINNPGTVISSGLSSAAQSVTNAYNNASTSINNAISAVENFSAKDSLVSLQNDLQNVDINFQPSADVFNTSISLYMPETVNFTYDVHYNDNMTLADAAKGLPLIGKIAGFLQDNQAAKALLYKNGFVFNPQQQVMFEGVGFREYQMDFVFTPYSPQEAATVNNIIKAFRRAASPTKITEAAGMFFRPPSVFEVEFHFNGNINPNLNKIKRSVLKNVNVDYAPNGWAAYDNGQPVQTKMTLQFMELELVTRADIEGGF
jgi:hypothetical protein